MDVPAAHLRDRLEKRNSNLNGGFRHSDGWREWPLPFSATGSNGSIAANSTRFGRARSSDEKIVLEPRLKVTVEDSLRHNMRLPFDASVETTKT